MNNGAALSHKMLTQYHQRPVGGNFSGSRKLMYSVNERRRGVNLKKLVHCVMNV